jgi:serine/threonine protein kinase
LTLHQLITLLYGGNFFIFKPDVPADHDDYELKILQRQCEFFGPFPLTYREICPQEKLNALAYIMQSIPPERRKPFSRISEQEISKEDKEFVLKVMKLDPRDRPSAAELLQDKWFAA